jgi:CHAT domain-containing protein
VADLPPGEDWVSLTRAFLHAGAAQVVATLWPVEDQSTASLMERFYQTFAAGAHPAEALSQAQRALLASPHTAHPFYWAAFVNVGSAEKAR